MPTVKVELLADASALQRAYLAAENSTKKFDKTLSASTRGITAASGAFHSLGRSVAFASGTFLGFAAATEFIKSSIDAARDAEKAQKSLAAQMRAVGESFAANRKRVQDASLAYGKFGFENDEVTKSLTVLERGTGNINRALGLQTTAANLARAKNLDLAAAANVLAKVFGGQETALRRAVPGLEKNAHGLDLIREAGRRLAGQAAANTTEVDKFNAILHNTKEIVGTALLPTLDDLIQRLGNWLDKMNRTGRLQRDVNGIVKTATGLINALKAALEPAAAAFKALGDAVGGTKNEIVLLTAAFVAFKATAKLSALTAIATGVSGIGAAAGGATAKVSALRLALGRLPTFILITVAIEAIINRKKIEAQIRGAVQGVTTAGAPSPVGLPFSKLGSGDTRPNTSGQFPNIHFNFAGGPDIPTAASLAAIGRGDLSLPHVSGAGRVNAPLTAQQNLALALARNPTDVGLLRQQAAFDQKQIAFLKKLHDENRISNKNFITQTEAFWNDYNATLDTINSLGKKAASDAKARLSQNIPSHVGGEAFGITSAGFFGRVGGLPGRTGGVGAFGVQHFNLPILTRLKQAQLEATGDTAGLNALLVKERQAAEKMIRSGKLAGEAQIEAWDFITNVNNQLAGALNSFGPTGKVRSSQALTSGVAFASVAARREQEARIAEALAYPGGMPAGPTVQGVNLPPIHVDVDGKTIARIVTDHQERLGQHQTPQRRGHTAGRGRFLP